MKIIASKSFISTTLVALLGYAVFKYFDTEDTPVVTISKGDLVGFVSRSREGSEFFQFLGIPYGKPPIGELRFEPPQPSEKWEGVRKAKKYGSMCTHVNSISRSIEGNEDCLYLNVFTPKFAGNPKDSGKPLLPVFVYVHGGYFMAGGSNYMGPLYLMEEKIILVTINYRLASLGFLNSADGAILGNMGMRDQVLALKFVQREIANFGGDPSKVVLWGESAGAAAVHFHQLSPMSEGLFAKAIMSSGTAIKPWSLSNQPREQALNFAKKLNCPVDSSDKMVKCLKNLDSRTLVGTHLDALDTPIMDPMKMFSPSVEVSNSSNSFLPQHPYDILKQGKAHRVPVLTGVNSHEGLLATARIYYNSSVMNEVESMWNDLSPVFFYYNKTLTEVTRKIKQFYFGASQEELEFKKKFANFTNLFSDRWYIHSMTETVLIQSQYSPVFLYYFSYTLERGLTFFYDITPNLPISIQIVFKVLAEWVNKYLLGKQPVPLGTCHGDELVLMYNFPMVYIDVGDKDYELSRQMIQAFVQFAYDESMITVGETQWEPVNASVKSRNDLKYMHFGNEMLTRGTFIDEPFSQRMDFWDSLNLPWKMSI